MARPALHGDRGRLFFSAWQIRTKAEDSKLWPRVPGMIEQSKVEFVDSGGYQIKSSSSYLVVQYKYQVASRYYTNDKIPVGGGQPQMGVKKGAEHYSVGTEVDVYYDPNNPQDSVLETWEGASRFYQLVGGAFIFFGVLAYLGLIG